MAIQVISSDTFEAFLAELGQRFIRLVKLADYGFVGSLTTSTGAIIMAPQLRVVATAFDKDQSALIRWQSAPRASSRATVGLETISGIHGNVEVAARKEDLRKLLELEGYAVSDGEWTRDEIDRLVAKRAVSAHGA